MRRRPVLWGAIAVLAGLAACDVPPASGPAPWIEEIPRSRWETLPQVVGDVESRFDAARRILDPRGDLDAILRKTAQGLVVDAPGRKEPLFVPFPTGPPMPAPAVRRILLDPGHRGGAWSEIEARHMFGDGHAPIREGDFAFVTARLVQEALSERGFEVQLTRGGPPEAPYPHGAFPGYDPQLEVRWWMLQRRETGAHRLFLRWYPGLLSRWWFHQVTRLKLRDQDFDLYNRFELRARAEQAGLFAPDLTVSLHYNASAKPELTGVVLFVHGNSVEGELDTESERFYAVRRLLEGSLWSSIEAAVHLGHAMQEHLSLPVATNWTEIQGREGEIDPAAGIYARNLAILRQTPGPIVLVEGPFVTHPGEVPLLTRATGSLDGLPVPMRARQYAAAVVQGLLETAESRRPGAAPVPPPAPERAPAPDSPPTTR